MFTLRISASSALVDRHSIHFALLVALLLISTVWLSSAPPEYLRTIRLPQDEQTLDTLHRLSLTLETLQSHEIQPYAAALAENSKFCPLTGPASKSYQGPDPSDFWEKLSEDELRHRRDQLVQTAKHFFGLDRSSKWSIPSISRFYGQGRGIVLTGGNKDTLHRLYASLTLLRTYGCMLPVEIWSFPGEVEKESHLKAQIESLGNVRFKQATTGNFSPGAWKNWHIKGEALLKTSFSEFLYMDSDNIPLTDPSYLFSHPLYLEHGAVFWPNCYKESPANPVWRMFGLNCRPREWPLEAGQIIFNKRGQNGLNLAVLVLADQMQRERVFWYKLSQGDTDCFRYSFYALGLEYTAAPHWHSAIGVASEEPVGGHSLCGLGLVQYGLSADDWLHFRAANISNDDSRKHAPPLFVHANLLKHSAGRSRGNSLQVVKRLVHDNTSEVMDNARAEVFYNTKGLCWDLWDFYEDGVESTRNFDNGEVVIESVKDSFGGVLRDVEDLFYSGYADSKISG